ncbi:DUF859 domain-containing protein [Streptococcus pneumoniae]|uniref:DUF859 domain-containing protein n=1 Tax=Streptococcus pneumoniae TaxID=1313 RepID=UPI000F822EC0|nr:DUF859 domain-containing protein [Streptococcus pneumoniae]RTZ09612.1 hypothetical protein CWI07_12310 [Streptococcus pneumoniae]
MADFWSNTNRGYTLRLWVDQVSQNIPGNSSQVRLRLALLNKVATFAEYDCTAYVTVDGQTINWSGRPSMLEQDSVIMLFDRTVTVNHNADGTKTFNLTAGFEGSGGWSPSGLYISDSSFTLSTIPRSSSVSVSNATIGDTITININRQSPSFKHTVRYSWAGKSGTIASSVDTSATWSIPIDFANDIPDSASGTGTIYVDTYSGNTKTGTQSITFTASVPANVKPTFTGITLSDLNGNAQNLIPNSNTFIQIISNIKVAFNGAVGSYGSSITGYRAEIVGKNQTTDVNGGSLGIMNYHGPITIRASVSDSRGRWSDTREVSVTVLEYFAPALSFNITRTGSTSSTLTVTRNAKVAPLLISGSQKNSMRLTFKVARLGTDTYQVDNGPAAGSWTSIFNLTNSNANLAGNYLANQSWVVIGTLEDKFTRSEFMVNVATESVVFSYDRSGVGVNKIRERGALDVKGDIFANDNPIQQYQLTDNRGYGKLIKQDFNNMKDTGFWWIDGSSPNNPFRGSWGMLEVFRPNPNTVEAIQRFTTSNGYMAVRELAYDGTTRPWRYVAQQSETTNNSDIPKLPSKEKIVTTDDIPKLFQGEPWQVATLQNGWNHYIYYGKIQFSKSFDNIVYFRGSCRDGNTDRDTVIFTLPPGFRPEQDCFKLGINYDNDAATFKIGKNGDVSIVKNADNRWLNLDNISFKI